MEAATWVEQCVFPHEPSGYGEHAVMTAVSSDPVTAVYDALQTWYNEVAFYVYGFHCTYIGGCSYTQVKLYSLEFPISLAQLYRFQHISHVTELTNCC